MRLLILATGFRRLTYLILHHCAAHTLQLEQLSHSNVKEFFIQVVDMMDSSSLPARSMATISLCNFLSKGKGREKINLDELHVLLPKFLRFLSVDKGKAMSEAEIYLAGLPCDLLFGHLGSFLLQAPLPGPFVTCAAAAASASNAATLDFWEISSL